MDIDFKTILTKNSYLSLYSKVHLEKTKGETKMKILKTIDTEKKNVWDFVTFLANIAAAAFITRLAVLETDTIYRTMFAIIASVLIVNILAKLYGLIRNQ